MGMVGGVHVFGLVIGPESVKREFERTGKLPLYLPHQRTASPTNPPAIGQRKPTR